VATILTSRLVLRPFTSDGGDVDSLFGVFSRPEVARWSGQGVPMTHRDEAVARIGRMAERQGDHPAAGILAVVPHGTTTPVGMALLVPIPSSAGAAAVARDDHEIGWHLHPDVWGRGYAVETATALVQRAFASGLDTLVAVIDPDNVRSQAVCRRLGMTDLGLRDDWYDRRLRAFRLDHP
jgi:RimJ/RimL family protein N-acetyltransferase